MAHVDVQETEDCGSCCPECQAAVSPEATRCDQCGALFPAMHDRQGSMPMVAARLIVVPIAVMAIASTVFACLSLVFFDGWDNLFMALFYGAFAVGFGYVARRLYIHPSGVTPPSERSGRRVPELPQWQQLALEHLPQSREVVLQAESHVDLWQLLKEVVAEEESTPQRRTEIEAIFRYAWWCVHESGDADLRSEVEAFFYEDLPVYSDLQEKVSAFVTPSQFSQLESAFATRLEEDEFQRFRSDYFNQTRHG